MTQGILIGRSSLLRRSIALDLNYKSAQKRAVTELYRRQRRQKNIEQAKSAPKVPKRRKIHIFMKNILWCHIFGLITRDLLIGSSSFLRRSIALDFSYRSAQKRAPTELCRRRRRRKIVDHAKSAPRAPKNEKSRFFYTFL